jgi:two-component system response regulator MprA
MVNKTILIVEDDAGIRKYLKELFSDNNYLVHEAADGIAALNALQKLPPDLVLLDLGLPTMSGEAVCTEIKKKYPAMPIIILTARDQSSDIVHGLNLGADDYVTKPFIADELLARVTARFRTQGIEDKLVRIADLEFDPKSLEVRRSGKVIHLTPQELKLLEYLMKNKDRVLTREMILNRVWSYSLEVESRVVDIYMGYLRKKIDAGYPRKLLHSVRGFGYMIKDS